MTDIPGTPAKPEADFGYREDKLTPDITIPGESEENLIPYNTDFPPETPEDEDETEPTKPVKKGSPNRLTVVEQIHHQVEMNEPISILGKFVRMLSSDESCFSRLGGKIGEQWKRIDLGWIEPDDVGTVVIKNISGRYLKEIPTEEEQQELDSRIIEVGLAVPEATEEEEIVPVTEIPPGEHFRIHPLVPGDHIWIRSANGISNYNLYVIPD